MQQILLAVLTLLALLGLGLCLILLQTVSRLRSSLDDLGKQMGKIAGQVDQHNYEIQSLREELAQRMPTPQALGAAISGLLGVKRGGMGPLVISLGWRFLKSRMKKKETQRSLPNKRSSS